MLSKKGLFGIVASIGLLTACGNNNGNQQVTPESYDEGETIRIGSNFALSGDVAGYGGPGARGVELAVSEINEAGGILGKQIELIDYDNQSLDTEAATISTRLANEDQVSIIMGPDVSGSAVASLQPATQAEVPLFAVMASLDYFTQEGQQSDGEVLEYAWRVAYPDAYQGEALASFAAGELGATKAAILGDNSTDYAVGLVSTFEQVFPGEVVAIENYTAGDTDFSATLTTLAGKDFDVLFIPGYYEEAGPIIKQARELGIDAPILGPDGFGNSALYTLAGEENMNDVYYTTQFSALDASEHVIEFMNNYEEKYGEVADMFAAMGYDAMYVTRDAIERAGSANPQAINDELKNTENFPGVTGTFSFDELHNPVKTVTIIEVQNGEDVRTIEVNPE